MSASVNVSINQSFLSVNVNLNNREKITWKDLLTVIVMRIDAQLEALNVNINLDSFGKCTFMAAISLRDRDMYQLGMVLALYEKSGNNLKEPRNLVNKLNKGAVWKDFIDSLGGKLDILTREMFLSSAAVGVVVG
jgi:hypothetical protein